MKYLRAFLLFCLPSFILKFLGLPACGFSLIIVNKCKTGGGKIGHLNFIKVKCFDIDPTSKIGHLNFIRGDFDVKMEKSTRIDNQNKISTKALPKDRFKPISLTLKERSRIGTGHYIDMSSNFTLGVNSMLAGSQTQVWTHGFFFDDDLNRPFFRVDGDVVIDSTCYIGARCTLLPGIHIVDKCVLGAGSIVSKSLLVSGTYVSQPLRYIKTDIKEVESRLKKNERMPNVYEKVIE